MTKLLIAASIAALSLTSVSALAQGKGKGGGNPPTWQGSNPPGFNSPGNRTGWGTTTPAQPPGWSNTPTRPGWGSGSVPPGLNNTKKK